MPRSDRVVIFIYKKPILLTKRNRLLTERSETIVWRVLTCISLDVELCVHCLRVELESRVF